MKKVAIATLLAGASAFVSTPASAAQQIISFGGVLDYGSVWDASPFGSPYMQLGGKAYSVVMSYDPALFANTGTCGSTPASQCNFFFTPSRALTAVFTVDGVSETYTWTSGEFYLSAGGNDQFGFNFYGSAGSFSGSFGDGNSFYPDQGSVNTPILSDFTNLGLTHGTFQFNSNGFGFGDAPGSLSASYTTGTPGAVPEPATWAMMILGLGLVGGVLRAVRRRQKITVAYA